MLLIAASFVFTLVCDGALGAIVLVPGDNRPTTGPVTRFHQVRRLTNNNVRDARPFISARGTVYWERFGGDQGDVELFYSHVSSDSISRLTRNNLDERLYAPSVWVSGAADPNFGLYLGNPFIRAVDKTTFQPAFDLIRSGNRANRRREIFRGGLQLTHNNRFETEVQLADNPDHGMVWLSKKIPRGSTGFTLSPGFDIFWSNGQHGRRQRIKRINGATNALAVAMGRHWAGWTTLSQDEVVLRHIRTGETRTLAADAPVNIELAGRYVKYVTSQAKNSSSLIGSFGDVDLSFSGFESRVRVYDIVSDTTITVGDDPSLGFHRDFQSVLSDQYVAFNRSFINPLSLPVTSVFPPQPWPTEITELRLFDLDTLTDILVTDGQGIEGLQIDGNTLIWQMLDTSAPLRADWDLEIFAYDIVGGVLRQVTDNDVDDFAPQISGDNIVWTARSANGETDIFLETFVSVPQGVSLLGGDREIGGLFSESQPATAVVAAVPEPASAALMSVAGVLALGRSRSRRRA